MWYVTSHPVYISLAIPPCVGTMSSNKSWEVNRNSTSPITMVSQTHSVSCCMAQAVSLRSAGTSHLVFPPVRLSSVANRAFQVVGQRIWNDLPVDVTSAESLSTFRQ